MRILSSTRGYLFLVLGGGWLLSLLSYLLFADPHQQSLCAPLLMPQEIIKIIKAVFADNNTKSKEGPSNSILSREIKVRWWPVREGIMGSMMLLLVVVVVVTLWKWTDILFFELSHCVHLITTTSSQSLNFVPPKRSNSLDFICLISLTTTATMMYFYLPSRNKSKQNTDRRGNALWAVSSGRMCRMPGTLSFISHRVRLEAKKVSCCLSSRAKCSLAQHGRRQLATTLVFLYKC